MLSLRLVVEALASERLGEPVPAGALGALAVGLVALCVLLLVRAADDAVGLGVVGCDFRVDFEFHYVCEGVFHVSSPWLQGTGAEASGRWACAAPNSRIVPRHGPRGKGVGRRVGLRPTQGWLVFVGQGGYNHEAAVWRVVTASSL